MSIDQRRKFHQQRPERMLSGVSLTCAAPKVMFDKEC